MSDAPTTEPCDDCGDPTTDALARTVRLSVDRANIDTQRLCPDCFADWIQRYQDRLGSGPDDDDSGSSEIIVD
ncbi:DUF7569 family protein [Halorubrum lacusprofundi]|jgi:hypothetical protein|uniref:Small CPxCG-related zinc finger protein n=1 Tax=Halorubrum lacusprofundi (strain ATCC 49239 / DSM 5036 / JCM 8891 / ACAM 34) TaxID=416348 RepID=B9LUM2_HALLT|nr:hypothetical protein [Halorubrum lacusprofundi]ACM58289.1 conserved hypothetical protein [Halorubrum lacusprofundi ATCC 49239]MCG1006371.1 hypothetical protein [Halorubrum lacusprofundi]